MPELPEVETIVRQLRPQIVGDTLLKVKVVDLNRLSSFAMWVKNEKFAGSKIVSIERYGKYIILRFERKGRSSSIAKYFFITIHLRMTGRLYWKARGDSLEKKALRCEFNFSSGTIQFCDIRRFGTVEASDVHPFCFEDRLIVDPLSEGFSLDWFSDQSRNCRQNVKIWLLRQDRLLGIGNIYASEALYASRIHPSRVMNSLSRKELGRLRLSIRKILADAIKNGGTTFSDFRDSEGKSGNHQNSLKVYNREGEPCSNCASLIVRATLGGRSTYYCECCQL